MLIYVKRKTRSCIRNNIIWPIYDLTHRGDDDDNIIVIENNTGGRKLTVTQEDKPLLHIHDRYNQTTNDIIIMNIIQNKEYEYDIKDSIRRISIEKVTDVKNKIDIYNNDSNKIIGYEEDYLNLLYKSLFKCDNIGCKQVKSNSFKIQRHYSMCYGCKACYCNSCVIRNMTDHLYCFGCRMEIKFCGSITSPHKK